MKITVRQLNETLMCITKCSKPHENKSWKYSLNKLIEECIDKKVSFLDFSEDSALAILIVKMSESYKDILKLNQSRRN